MGENCRYIYVLLKICCNFRFHHGLNLSSLTLVVQLMMLTSLYQIPLHVFKVCFNGHQLDVIQCSCQIHQDSSLLIKCQQVRVAMEGGREGGRVHFVPLKEKMGHLSCITYMTHITATKQYNQRKWQTKETRLRVLRKENLSIRQIYNKKKIRSGLQL